MPARLSNETLEKIAHVAVVAHHTLGLAALSRIDLIVDQSGEPWFLEANALPGLTETSSAPLAIEAAGFELADLYDALVRAAL